MVPGSPAHGLVEHKSLIARLSGGRESRPVKVGAPDAVDLDATADRENLASHARDLIGSSLAQEGDRRLVTKRPAHRADAQRPPRLDYDPAGGELPISAIVEHEPSAHAQSPDARRSIEPHRLEGAD